jgi:flagellar M-ring protein FliF
MVYRNKTYDQATLEKADQLNGQSWDDYKASIAAQTPLTIDFTPIKDIIAKGTGLNSANISVQGYEVPLFVDAAPKQVDLRQLFMFAALALLLLLLIATLFKGMPAAEVTEVEPELSVEELLETTRMEEARKAEAEKLEEIELDKEPESKKLIEKFVNERPEAAAQLLRNWLNDNWE